MLTFQGHLSARERERERGGGGGVEKAIQSDPETIRTAHCAENKTPLLCLEPLVIEEV